MIDLKPCGECQRHVAVTDSACPFCGAATQPSSSHLIALGRLSRAAVFFTGAALAASACGGKTKPVDTHVDQAAASDAGVGKSDAPAVEPEENNQHRHPGGGGQNMPYGAPPARRRLV